MAPGGAAYYRLAIVLGALSAMGPLAIDMYLPALPTISRDLGASAAAVQLSLAAYFIGIALGQAFYGPLSDRVGRKPALYSGLIIFALASIGCALAPSIEVLVVCRFLQALGGCAPLVIPRAVVRDQFDERGSVRMLSTLILVMGAAPILAPLLGGQLLTAFGWRSVFWLLTAYAVVWLLLAIVFLPESLPPAQRRRESFSVVLAVYAALLRDRLYLRYVVVGSLVFSGLLAYIASSPFVFIELFRVPPERFGLFFGMNAVGLIAASQVNGWLAARMDPRRILRLVLPVSAGSGVLLLVDAATGFGGFPGILVPLFLYIATHGFVMPNTIALAMGPHGRVAGSASALLGTIQFVLGAAAGAAVGLLGNGTAVPLAAVVAGCGLAAWSVYQTLP
jgi:DHA1 family bicyclomycin/chloramphenicol resistance-like MFS transporter